MDGLEATGYGVEEPIGGGQAIGIIAGPAGYGMKVNGKVTETAGDGIKVIGKPMTTGRMFKQNSH